jgi:hypothetical protein
VLSFVVKEKISEDDAVQALEEALGYVKDNL